MNIEELMKNANNTIDLTEMNMNPDNLETLMTLGVNGKSDAALEETFDEIVETSEPEVEIDTSDITEPNIILRKTELVRALKYASVMIRKVTADIESSSLNITLGDGNVLYKLKDNMTYVELTGDVKVANDKPLEETLSFNASYLLKLLTAAAANVVIYKTTVTNNEGVDKPVYMIRLANGDFILDVNVGDDSKLEFPGVKKDLLYKLDPTVVSGLHDIMTPLINNTQEIQSKRMVVYNDRAFFKSTTFILQYRGTFSPMCLGKKELDLLKLVSSGSDSMVEFYSVTEESSSENRVIIVAPNIKISTLVSIPNRDEILVERFNVLENAKYMKVNRNEFNRVLFLSGLGTNTVSRVTMNYNVDGNGIDARIISRDGKSNFTISGDNYNNLEPKENDVEIYAVQLMQLLKSFEKGNNTEVAFLQQGVAFRDASLGIEALMNYSSY